MLKKFLYSAALAAMLSGSGLAPAQADELYIRNRPFKDAYFIGGTTYVPVEGFLKAVEVPWRVDGEMLVLGEGSSPALDMSTETLRARHMDKNLTLNGILRGGTLYVPATGLAKFVGYSVNYSRETGIVDVIQGRLTTDMDEKAASEVQAANQAEQEARQAAWQERVEKARAARKAKEEAEEAENGDDLDADTDSEDAIERERESREDLAAKGDPDVDPTDTETQAIDGKDDREDASYEADVTEVEEENKKSEPPPEANLVVLSSEADPNNYDGTVVFRAVLQNQGYVDATNVKARLKVVGPDQKEWINKTIYHGPISPDGRWVITENYRHRLGASIPRGQYDVTVTPTYDSAAPKE